MAKYYRHPLSGPAPLVGTSLTNVQASRLASTLLASETFDDPPVIPGGAGEIKVWEGSSFVSKPVKVWLAGSWQVKPLKRWTGSDWVTT